MRIFIRVVLSVRHGPSPSVRLVVVPSTALSVGDASSSLGLMARHDVFVAVVRRGRPSVAVKRTSCLGRCPIARHLKAVFVATKRRPWRVPTTSVVPFRSAKAASSLGSTWEVCVVRRLSSGPAFFAKTGLCRVLLEKATWVGTADDRHERLVSLEIYAVVRLESLFSILHVCVWAISRCRQAALGRARPTR